MLSYLGNVSFEDIAIPVPGKNEWGVDTLSRRLRGSRALLRAFIATLRQGQRVSGYPSFFLQTWSVDDDTPFAEITLNYKGLLNGTPPVDVQTDIVAETGTTTADYSSENSGLGRQYKTIPLYRYSYETPSGLVTDIVVATRPIYTVAARMEFEYYAVQIRYRYVTIGRSSAQDFPNDDPYIPQVIRGRITTSDGATFGTDRVLFFGLTPVLQQRLVSFTSHNIIGTPYYEAEAIVRKELGNA